MINFSKLDPRGRKNYKIIFREKARQLRQQLPGLALGIIIIVGSIYILLDLNNLSFNITIDNQEKVSKQQILSIIKDKKLSNIQTEIKNLAWVNNLKIKRKWNKIELIIGTNNLVYNYANEDKIIGFINQNGKLFSPKFLPSNNYPTIITDKSKITASFHKLATYSQIIPNLEIDKFINKKIEILILKNGSKIILGRIKQEQRLARMAKHLKIFKFRENSIVDLRYKNGFAKTN